MKCQFCNSEWNSAVQTNACPFCGRDLIINEKMDISAAIKKVVSDRGIEVLHSSKIVMAYISDYVQGYDREKKLFKHASANGMLDKVYEIVQENGSIQRELLIKKLEKHLVDEAFLSEDNAQIIVNIVLVGLGVSLIAENQTLEENNEKRSSVSSNTGNKDEEDIANLSFEDMLNRMFPQTESKGDSKLSKNELTDNVVEAEKKQPIKSISDKFAEIVSTNGKVTTEECIEIFNFGKKLIIDGNETDGVKYIRFAAQHGNKEAAILLGDFYNKGVHVQKDWKIAEAYYRQAAVSGDHTAEYKLGTLLRENKGFDPYSWLKKAADAGVVSAEYCNMKPTQLKKDQNNTQFVDRGKATFVVKKSLMPFSPKVGSKYVISIDGNKATRMTIESEHGDVSSTLSLPVGKHRFSLEIYGPSDENYDMSLGSIESQEFDINKNTTTEITIKASKMFSSPEVKIQVH